MAQHCLVVQAVLVGRCSVMVLAAAPAVSVWVESITQPHRTLALYGCPEDRGCVYVCVTAGCWCFPEDSHALDKPQTEVEPWLNIAWWFEQYL